MTSRTQDEVNELLENEWYVVRHSGEIPEIALHSSLYFLTRDVKGPLLELTEAQSNYLLDAALSRFKEIILRDITPENRDKTIYRGIKRTIANWERFEKFCGRQDLSSASLREDVVTQLQTFLEVEASGADSCGCGSIFNCSLEEFEEFAQTIGLPLEDLPAKLSSLCLGKQTTET